MVRRKQILFKATGRPEFYLHLHDATYQDDGPQQESTEDVDVGPSVEEEDFSSLRERRQIHTVTTADPFLGLPRLAI